MLIHVLSFWTIKNSHTEAGRGLVSAVGLLSLFNPSGQLGIVQLLNQMPHSPQWVIKENWKKVKSMC